MYQLQTQWTRDVDRATLVSLAGDTVKLVQCCIEPLG
jgi:hypothetical protein